MSPESPKETSARTGFQIFQNIKRKLCHTDNKMINQLAMQEAKDECKKHISNYELRQFCELGVEKAQDQSKSCNI